MPLPVKFVVYYRTRPSDLEASAAALVAQNDAVAAWIAANSATILAEFTEAEDGRTARPQLGKALALCRREDARLLVARTNPIGSGEPFGSLYGDDISGVRCERLTQPVGIVVYLRTRPSQPAESDSSLASQREAVAAWLRKRPTVFVAEHVEIEENDEAGRPALAAALGACLRDANGTTLLVGTLAAIGTGPALQLPSTRVPVEVAWSPPPEPHSVPRPEDIALPSGAPDEIALFFNLADGQRLSVYLCNPRTEPLSEVQVSSIGETTHGPSRQQEPGSILSTSVSRKELGTVPPRTGRFLEFYDLFWDGDFVTSYQITYRGADGTRLRSVAVAGTGGPDGPFIRFSPARSASVGTSASI